MIENLSKLISEKVSSELNYDNERKEIIQYGTYALIQTLISIISVFIIGLLFNIALEALIFLFTASILRKYSGGAHSESSNVCTLLGIIISICIGFLVKSSFFTKMNFEIIVFIGIVIFVFGYFIVFKFAPVDTKNKPIKTEKKKKRMKKGSLKILTIYLFIEILSIILYYNLGWSLVKSVMLSIILGVAWQCITLTYIGNILLKTIDSFTNKLL
ncbi:accessory gene regulator ArgB-like protein [Clostridium perfringens]|uniref:Putative AgrB-like protein n=2 Tax=Clostridium perfringens TaxID=1502 RepID=AGRB_CLOPS|nr:accessory gene regulator B family protein [Clostridium perfringens]Q0SSQ8.1 RecName: Full=Putative AgrB-like protein [Clostridium perfringens SM101]ABG86149.1 putative accessory gene regulator protein B [Clostridium perfringens SM101]EJT5925272.1 accessory gene regulator B family protein [Clostridium perfringens]EJT5939745.1 accessory gene regulator B family protein [Clostridium perfringens]EJT6471791.1 accessory gene regulator B family protein [Clostridium perfringens]MBP2861482.1 accesso